MYFAFLLTFILNDTILVTVVSSHYKIVILRDKNDIAYQQSWCR